MAQSKKAVVPTVHPSPFELALASASWAISVGPFEATSGGSSEIAFADAPEVALVSTSRLEHHRIRPPWKKPASTGTHISTRGERGGVPLGKPDRSPHPIVGLAKDENGIGGETETEVGEEGGSLIVFHSGPSDGGVVVPEVDFDLGKEGIVGDRGVRVQVPRDFSFVAKAER